MDRDFFHFRYVVMNACDISFFPVDIHYKGRVSMVRQLDVTQYQPTYVLKRVCWTYSCRTLAMDRGWYVYADLERCGLYHTDDFFIRDVALSPDEFFCAMCNMFLYDLNDDGIDPCVICNDSF